MSHRIDTPPASILDNTPTLTPDRWTVGTLLAVCDDAIVADVRARPSGEPAPSPHHDIVADGLTEPEAEELVAAIADDMLRTFGQG